MTTPAQVRYRKRYCLDRAQGIPRGYVPAGPVRDHVKQLVDAGMTRRGIAVAANVSPTTVGRLLDGQYAGCQRGAAARLLAVTPAAIMRRPDDAGRVPAIGSRRRIQALLALGWRHSDITAHMPSRHWSSVVLHQEGPWVTRQTHDSVRAAYDVLAMRPGPSQSTRDRARAYGYVPPLAWDDDQLDDPTARHLADLAPTSSTGSLDEVAIDRAVAGQPTRLTAAERVEAIRRLAAQGLSDAQMADRLQVSARTIDRDRQSHHIPTGWRAA